MKTTNLVLVFSFFTLLSAGLCERPHKVYKLKMDEALLIFHNELPYIVSVYYTSDYCYKCLYQPLATVENGQSNISVVVSTQFTLTLKIMPVDGNDTLCSLSQTFEEAGHYSLWMRSGLLNDVTCSLTVDRSPNNAYLPLLAAFLILASITAFWASLPYILRCSCTQRLKNRICHRGSLNSIDLDEANNEHSVDKIKSKSSRLKSLDTFRGVFYLCVYITALVSLSWLRIPGVLQRLGFTYFVLALMQTFSPHREIPLREHNWWNPIQDLVLYWPEWIFIVLLETMWLCLTFLLPVPNCPTGYLGAGGIGDDGLHPNCTGGAAAYIDRWLFGDNIFWYPTCKVLYRTTEPFDPEGVLGTINSIVMGFFGMQAGKILLFFRKRNKSILARFLIWALILGISAAILSKCTRDEGFIPVNKNLWSLSFVTCMGCMSFVLLGLMYFVVDIKEWWGGQPFIYPGMNSIFVYVGHSLLGFYFPFSWEKRFQDSHWEQLFQNIWGTSLWVFIAYLLYRKRFFLKI
ncbi:heparan-alpha-glucosaminide N-acetyltransferase [Carassius auratus]|uniref:Heparan-alpha-glucosaminide N-acetyltransferase n=1 Tax=Carassius auratus TaxID=7957 RepID=A0A6P6LBS9_CARAU|nr:heparan-alpha-glucosaminide N-acetyltransferase-like [Carassius auratus]